MNYCPVCGFNLRKPVEDDLICPSCGTQFGYTDAVRTHDELRKRWLTNPRWFSQAHPQPPNWNPYTQLANLETKEARIQSTFKPNPMTRLYLGRGYRTVREAINYSVDSHWEIITGEVCVVHA